MSDAFTKPEPDAFSIDAWITGARLPERTSTVYGRADLAADLEALESQLNAARSSTASDDRLGSPTSPSALARRILDLREEMSGSALAFRFRAIPKSAAAKITKDAPIVDGEPDADYVAREWVAAASVEPKLTPEQAQSVRDHIGEGQFATLWEAAWSATNDKRVSVPFSQAALVTLNTEDS